MKTVLLIPLLVLTLLARSYAAPGDLGDLKEQQKKNQALIDDARKEQKKIEAELGRLGAAAKTADQQIRLVELELRRAEAEVTIQRGRVRETKEELSGIAGAITVSTRNLAEQQRRLRLRARAILGMTLTAEHETLARPAELADLEVRLSALEIAARGDAGLVRATRERREELHVEKSEKETLLARLAREEKRLRGVETEVASKREELRALKAKIASKTKATKESLEKTKTMIASTIQTMVKTQARLKELEKKYGNLEGKFPRPVNGDFFQPDELLHMDGVYIDAKYGTPVKTIAAGEVLNVQELRGIGITIVVGHGDNYTSSYSNLSSVSVTVGQSLKSGQVIGKSGTSPYGDKIFFAIFHNQTPVNAKSRLK